MFPSRSCRSSASGPRYGIGGFFSFFIRRIFLRAHLSTARFFSQTIQAIMTINNQAVSHYVKGDKMPSLDTFANLCIALDISPNEILSEKFF